MEGDGRNMNEKIVEMITQLIETGSSTALWFYIIYVVGGISKFVIGFGCLFLCVKRIGSIIKGCINEKKNDS